MRAKKNPTQKMFTVLELPTLPESEALGPPLFLLFLASYSVVKPWEPSLPVVPTSQHNLSCGVFVTWRRGSQDSEMILFNNPHEHSCRENLQFSRPWTVRLASTCHGTG